MALVQIEALLQYLREKQILAISEEQLRCSEVAAQGRQQSVLRYLLEQQLIDDAAVAVALAELLGVPFINLDECEVDEALLLKLGDIWVRSHRLLPLKGDGAWVRVAFSDPSEMTSADELGFHSQCNVAWVMVEDSKLNLRLGHCLHLAGCEQFDQSSVELPEDASFSDPLDDAPTVRVVDRLISDAVRKGASDLHFEPTQYELRVRFRYDGLLHVVARFPVNLSVRITARLKVMARMDVAEKRIPQDGRIVWSMPGFQRVDIRASSCPVLAGEKLVLRIHDAEVNSPDLASLGFESDQLARVQAAIALSHGLIVVTGPTGSGKTVTLYAALQHLNREHLNISTVEDPVERQVMGINQVNVHPKVGLGFAAVLRAFLRQDPDVIMLGEIRDLETAEIAVKAAQTGHLVLSTVHANDAPQTISRLLQMGVSPYSLASCLRLVIAQRLLRKLCPHCKQSLGLDKNEYQANACSRCLDGYRGRTGIFQVMPVSDALQTLILNGGSSLALAKQAQCEGVYDLRQAGVLRVNAGVTSTLELERVLLG